MIAFGTERPTSTFSIYEKGDFSQVILREGFVEDEAGWSWNEYGISARSRSELSEIVSSSFSAWLNAARELEISTASADARKRRNALLQESDWTQFSDCPLSSAKASEWAAYRQALRDIPQQSDFPHKAIFPVKPS